MNNLKQQLQQLPQIDMPEDIFPRIKYSIHNQNFIMRHRIISSISLVAFFVMVFLFFWQQNNLDNKDILIQELVKRTMQLEKLLATEIPTSSTPGSLITERIVNMESYLAKLDDDIKQTRDKQKISQLMATKLDLLANLVLLQRKINQKPNYQKVKPYII